MEGMVVCVMNGIDVDLRGRHAIVTGGGRGIGRAITLALAASGADVAVVYRDGYEAAEHVAAEAREDGVRSIAIQADVADQRAVQTMVDRVGHEFGTVEILVSNAGLLSRAPFLELTGEEWRRILTTNLDGSFYVGQAVAREMVRTQVAGAIVNVTSVLQQLVAPDVAHYVVSKAAQWALTRQMAYELAPYNIRVNAVAPGLTETDINQDVLSDPDYREKRIDQMPLRTLSGTEDQANAVLYLVSDAARTVTGEVISPNGGAPLAGVGPPPRADHGPT